MAKSYLAGLIALLAVFSGAEAQEPLTFKAWQEVDANQSGLVLLLEGGQGTVTLAGGNKEPIDVTEWSSKLPFLKQYRLAPGFYTLSLPTIAGAIQSVSIWTEPRSTVFLKIEDGFPVNGSIGVRLTSWVGKPSEEIVSVFTAAVEEGLSEALRPAIVETQSGPLYFFHQPPGVRPPPGK